MKTTILAATVLLALATVGTAQSAEAAPINIAPAGIVTLADFEADRSDLLHTVKGFKKGHHGHRGGRGFGRSGFGHRGFGNRGFRRGGFGHRGIGHNRFNQGHNGHYGKSFGLFGKFFGHKK